MTQKTAILITGMHRSGTSALARTVSLLGAKLPDELVPANAGNPLGHWEPKAVVALNDRMLADAGSNVYSIANFAADWFRTSRADQFREEAIALIKHSFGGDPLIVLKDPRTALFLPIWEDALDASGYRTVHILPLRSPAAVASSLRRRHLKEIEYDGWPTPRGELVWLRYTLAAVQGTRSSPRVFVRYEDLVADWKKVARRISDATGVVWPRFGSLETERSIDGFLLSSYEREPPAEPVDIQSSLRSLAPSLLAQALYQTLLIGDEPVRVDAISAEFETRVDGMRELVSAFEAMHPIVWQYYEEAGRKAAQLEAAHRTEAGMHQAVQSLWTNLNKHADDKGSLRQLLESTSERARSFEIAFEQRLSDSVQRESDFDREREELKRLAADLRGMVDYEASVRKDAEDARENLRRHAAELQAIVEEEVARRQGVEAGLQSMGNHAAQLQTIVEHGQAELKALRDHAVELQRVRAEEQRLAEQHSRTLSAHIAALEDTLSTIRRSWSWRLTGPTRVSARWLRNMMGL